MSYTLHYIINHLLTCLNEPKPNQIAVFGYVMQLTLYYKSFTYLLKPNRNLTELRFVVLKTKTEPSI